MPTLDIPYSTPYEMGLKQLHAVGQKAETPDGSIFRYTKMGGTIGVANKLYQSSIPVNDWITQVHSVAISIGDSEISHKTASTTFAANEAVGGTLILEEPTDLGHIYHVKSNTATASTQTVMQLEDGVMVQKEMNVVAGNVLTFIKNQWMDVIISPTGINTAPNAGIPRIIIAVGAYGWLQTRGPASCVIDADTDVPLLGNGLRASEDDEGGVALLQETDVVADYQHVGYVMETAANLQFGHIFLQIE